MTSTVASGLLTPRVAARMLGVDPRTLANWQRAGRISAVRYQGGHRRYEASEVERVLRMMERSR